MLDSGTVNPSPGHDFGLSDLEDKVCRSHCKENAQ